VSSLRKRKRLPAAQLRPSSNDNKNTDFANTDPEKQTLFCFVFLQPAPTFFFFSKYRVCFQGVCFWFSGLEKAAVATNPEILFYSVTTGRKHPRCPKSTKKGAAVTRNELFGVVTLATMVSAEFNNVRPPHFPDRLPL
jgi:hypothetical protein